MTGPHQAISYHNELAVGWDRRYASGSFARRFRFVEKYLLAGGDPCGRWLDAGCGSGTFSRLLIALGASEVLGLDGSARMVGVAEDHAKAEGIAGRAEFRVVDSIERLSCRRTEFDGALCLSVLEYLPSSEAALAELARVLRPGARCLVSIPHRRSALRRLQKSARRQGAGGISPGLGYLDSSGFTLDPAQAAGLFGATGFRISRQSGFDPFVPRALFAVFSPSLVFYDLVRSTGGAER